MISVVVSTIGAPFLIESLRTLRYPPDELLVIVDTVGRRTSSLDGTFPLDVLAEQLKEFPFVQLHHYAPDISRWSVMNGC